MKILFAVENYYPRVSGVPNVTRYLCEGLAAKGDDVAVVTCRHNLTSDEDVLNGVHIYRFNLVITLLKKYSGDVRSYVEFVKSYNPDVLILVCSQCVTTDVLLPHLYELSCTKIFYSHGFSGLKLRPFDIKDTFIHTIGNTYNYFRLKRYYKSFCHYLTNVDYAICLSSVDSGKPLLEEFTKVYIISNAADKPFFTLNKECNVHSLQKYIQLVNNDYLLSVANYSSIKNQKLLLREFYLSNRLDVAMVFIGSTTNSYYDSLLKYNKMYEKQYGKREVHFLHNVDRSDIPNIVNRAKLYLVGSDLEEFSISLIEAMAMGTPFISTDVGNAKILPGGVVSKGTDMHIIINELLDSHLEMERLSRMGMDYARTNCQQQIAIDKLYNLIHTTNS